MDSFWIGLGALVPSIGVGVLFFFAMRFVLRADKNEREQLAELDHNDPYVPESAESDQENSEALSDNSTSEK